MEQPRLKPVPLWEVSAIGSGNFTHYATVPAPEHISLGTSVTQFPLHGVYFQATRTMCYRPRVAELL